MPLGEYAQTVEDLGRDYEEETTQLQRSLEEELQTEIAQRQRTLDQDDEAAVAAFAAEVVEFTATRTATFFAQVGDALDRYRSQLEVMRPPDEVRERHDELVSAASGALDGIPDLLDGLAVARSFDEIDAAVYSSGFSDAQPRLAAACTALEEELTASGEAVNLRCPA